MYRAVLAVWAVDSPRVQSKTYEELLQEHLCDFQPLIRGSVLSLGQEQNLPTDKRLQRLKDGEEDRNLYALYYQYSRYLLISSSRKGTLPANLQGIWSWKLRPAWSSNWITNINLQMNYWPAQICSLEECMEPYFRFVKKICEQGKNTARIHYGCRGFVHHHNADFWCSTNPTGIPYQEKQGQRGSAVWPFWPMGGAWLASEFYRQYQYKPDRHFLETEVYPILREAARKSLAYRLEKGSGHTGWSCAWIINLYTILGEADKACEYLRMLLTKSTYPNLWDAHPPFQIDGNFGGLAGIAHMLLQTEEHLIKILPALPNEWEEGSVTGLRGRGDLTISISWDRRGCRADVCAGRYAYKGEFVYCEKTEKIELCAGERKKFDFHRGHRKPDFVKEY